MPASETFDAFYARTVWNVTSQMHELAGDDSTADHAIREAYAKAYQQWYQVSGYPDSEGWVFATAKDAWERRRAEAVGLRPAPAVEAADSGTWPGIYRPVAQPGRRDGGQGQFAADPDGTLAAPPRGRALDGDSPSAGLPRARAGLPRARAGLPRARAGWRAVPAAGATHRGGTAADIMAGDASDLMAGEAANGGGSLTPGLAGTPSRWPRQGTRAGLPGQLASRRNLIVAGVAIAALVAAVIAYGSGSGPKAPAATASQGTPGKFAAKPKPHMLPAGRTGRRAAIPWTLVGPGWALAEFSNAAPSPSGQASSSGSYTTYLVDPEGGKYVIAASSGTPLGLMAWSGDASKALVYTGTAAAGGAGRYALLNLRTGHFARLPLPDGVVPVGFARPLGLAILAVRQGPAQFHLQRYTLTGQLQKSLVALPRKSGETLGGDGCGIACALSSPDGLTDVWGVVGDGMQVVSNAGGRATRLHVKHSGHPSACMPLSWWNDTTVLADCAATGGVDGSSRLWLVPAHGGSPTPLTSAAGSASGAGNIVGAWKAGGTVYVTQSSFNQCQGAPSGPGGRDILSLGQGTNAAIVIPGSTHNFSTIVATQRQRLLVLTQTSCPGTSSLLWVDPSARTAVTALTAPPSETGVIAAVPFGNGPTAVTGGQY